MVDLQGKKIAVLGYGVEGKSTAKFLLAKGADVTILDINPKVKDKTKGFKWRLGKDYLKNLEQFDTVFRSPGIPYLATEIQRALKSGTRVLSQAKIFFDLCPGKIIGITGTKGKGTTAALIFAMLKESGGKAHLLGNIGEPMLDALDKIKKGDWAVLELSSFQLQDLDKSPHIAVVLDITSDHLDHHQSKKEYVKAKKNIVKFQTEKDFAIINADYFTSIEFAAETPAQIYFFSRRKLVDRGCYARWIKHRWGEIILRSSRKRIVLAKTYDIHLRGLHNLENITAAATAAYLAGASPSAISSAITSFKGLPYRLEQVRELNGIKFYNDSFATTPEATIAALKSFSEPIILIVGGRSKGGDYLMLSREISKRAKAAILIGEVAAEIKKQIGPKVKKILGLKDMKSMVKKAYGESTSGDVVLLSPAATSFDLFKDYKDRGDQFNQYVSRLR